MQETEQHDDDALAPPRREWHTPELTRLPAGATANGTGTTVDSVAAQTSV